MLKFRIGDIVQFVKNENFGDGIIIGMADKQLLVQFKNFCGGHSGNRHRVNLSMGKFPADENVRNCWYCYESELTLIKPTITEHIIRDNKIIVKLNNGKVGIAKCHPEDEFDVFVGTQLALARAYGKEPSKKEVVEVSRLAKVGEYVKVVDADTSEYNEYKNGDILKIVKNEKVVFVEKAFYKDEQYKYLNRGEYVVLENYRPPKPKKKLTLNYGVSGVVGTKTKLVDLHGGKLCVGDTVKLYSSHRGCIGEKCVCNDGDDFIWGIKGSKLERGIAKGGFVVIKERSYKEFKDGDQIDGVKYTLSEVK